MTTMALSALFGLVLAGQSKAGAPPADWPLKIAGAPQADVHRLLGRPRDTMASADRSFLLDEYSFPKLFDVSVSYGSGRVQVVTITFSAPPKDWRDALAKAGIAARHTRSARASRHSNPPLLVVDGVRGLKPGWGVLFMPSRVVTDMGVREREPASLQFVAPGLWER